MQPGIDVSIIIAAYNAEAFLAEAIESALAQQAASVEVIVVDDCSNDRTAAIAKGFADRGVRLVELAQNGGPGAARNEALAIARGTWIAVLDADDTMRPDRMARMIAFAERADADMAVDNLELVGGAAPGATMYAVAELRRLGRMDLPSFILSNRVFRSEANFGYMKPIVRRSYVEASGLRYDPSLRIGEDYVFLASALAEGACCAIDPQPGYRYSVRAGSISDLLELSHVQALQQTDAAFLREHRLDRQARAAMRKRARNLADAAAYLALIDHIKKRAARDAVATALARPAALRLLRMPVGVRLRRFAARLPVLRLV